MPPKALWHCLPFAVVSGAGHFVEDTIRAGSQQVVWWTRNAALQYIRWKLHRTGHEPVIDSASTGLGAERGAYASRPSRG
jgi:hypothetical protein